MPTLEASRHDFLQKVFRYIHTSERPRFTAVLDDFLDWSQARSARVEFVDQEYDQNVVSFRELACGFVLWSAYPRVDDGAKLEILPGSADKLTSHMHGRVLDVLRSISRESISRDTTLRIPFSSLKNPKARERVKALLDDLLAHLAERTARLHSPAS